MHDFFCMNLMNVVINRLCFVSDCVFFYKLNTDCVFYPVVTGDLTSVSLSLLWTRVLMSKWRQHVGRYYEPLSYHCRDALVATAQLPVARVTYDPLLQCLIVVVCLFCFNSLHEKLHNKSVTKMLLHQLMKPLVSETVHKSMLLDIWKFWPHIYQIRPSLIILIFQQPIISLTET
jgi:hypothetical protein